MPEMIQRAFKPRTLSDTGPELSFDVIVGFVRRHWRLIFGCAALFGAATAAVLLLVVGRTYEAAATLVIVPPKFTSDLKPQTLNAPSYQKILESDAVIQAARKRLIERHIIGPDKVLRLDKELEARIFVTRRAEEVTIAPMIQAVARGDTAAQAAAIANTWAEVLLERTHELMAGSTSATVRFIDQEYPKVREALANLEVARANEADTLQRRYDGTVKTWDDKITAFGNATTQLSADYEAETRRLVTTYKSAHNLDSRDAQVTALRKAYSDLQNEQARVSSQLQLRQLQLEAARRQLAATTPLVTLQKAITDETLWRAVSSAKGEGPDWKTLQGRALATQEVNPVYTSLNAKVAEIEMDVNAMVPRAAGLTADLERINTEMKSLETSLRDDQTALGKIESGREAGLTQLKAQRANEVGLLQRSRQSELDGLERGSDMRLAQLDRDIAQQRELFDQLAKSYNQALLAKGQQDVEDVRLGAPAVEPQTPRPRGMATKTLLGILFGLATGIGVALVRESWSSPEMRTDPGLQA
jgi:uncharacterized protein involved in exopolysaccharide biosynthesis